MHGGDSSCFRVAVVMTVVRAGHLGRRCLQKGGGRVESCLEREWQSSRRWRKPRARLQRWERIRALLRKRHGHCLAWWPLADRRPWGRSGDPISARHAVGDGSWNKEPFTGTWFPRVFYLHYLGYSKFFLLWTTVRFRNLRQANHDAVAPAMGGPARFSPSPV